MALMNHYHNQKSWNHLGPTPMYRNTESYGYMEQNNMMMEKRQLFLRSYQFCRKRSLTERIKRSLTRVKRVIWFKLRSARKLRRLVWFRLRFALFYRRRRFVRLLNKNQTHSSYCFC